MDCKTCFDINENGVCIWSTEGWNCPYYNQEGIPYDYSNEGSE